MADRGARGRLAAWLRLLPLAAAASLPLAACSVPDAVNPVVWYRDATGLSKNDPGPEAPNTKNLEAGGQQDYPSLSSVPPAPTQALSGEEREALTQHLIADRANAKYVDEQIRVGPASAAAPPPAPAPVVAKSAPPATQIAAATPPASPVPAAPAATPPAPAPQAASAEVAEAPSKESSLTSPEVQNLPEPETPRAAPPPPSADLVAGGAVPPVPPPPAPQATPAPQAAPAVAKAPVPAPPPAPVPAPPPRAAVPPPAPARPPAQVASLPPAAAPAPRPTSNAAAPIAQITFASNSARLSAADQRTLDEVVPMQQRSNSAVRVVGYAPEGHGTGVAQQLASFKMALDRANAVAAALREAGVEPNRILVEAAPPTDDAGVMAQRAEIFLVN